MENRQPNKFREFLASPAGYYTMCAVFAVIIWGVTLALWTSDNSELSAIVIIICAIFGWIALNKIQPSMFLWMSWIGWLIYFVLKFALSAVIGLFVAPFKIGRWIADKINNAAA